MSRTKKHEEHENSERWLVSYADFITLLFAFFVVLYATSTQNVEKEKRFEESIREKFRLVGAAGGKSTSTGGMYGQVVDPIDVFNRKDVNSVELEELLQKLLQQKMSDEERKTAISDIRHDAVGVRISLAESTLFPLGSAKLKREALTSLDKIAQVIKSLPNNLIIEGHTDDIPVAGAPYDSNWELASLRSTSVVKYLIQSHQFSPEKLAAISYADQRPMVPNTNPANRAKNRRIEILIVNEDPVENN